MAPSWKYVQEAAAVLLEFFATWSHGRGGIARSPRANGTRGAQPPMRRRALRADGLRVWGRRWAAGVLLQVLK